MRLFVLLLGALGCSDDEDGVRVGSPGAVDTAADTGGGGGGETADTADTGDTAEPTETGETGDTAPPVDTGTVPAALPACVDDGTTGIPAHDVTVGGEAREVVCRPAEDLFTLMVLPDTQIYSAEQPEVFEAQTSYVRTMYDHSANNTVFVLHVGDLVDDPLDAAEWTNARSAMDGLSAFDYGGVHHYIPYDIAWGDHDLLSWQDSDGSYDLDAPRAKHADYITGSKSTSTTYGFGVDVYKAAHTYDGDAWWSRWFVGYDYRDDARYGRNGYHFFDAGGNGYMALFLEFCPSADVLAWAEDRLAWFASGDDARRVILVMHSFLTTSGGLADWKWTGESVDGYEDWLPACWEFDGVDGGGHPSDVFERLVLPYNVQMVVSGHDNNSAWKGGTYARFELPAELTGEGRARSVHAVLANYQHVGSADGSVSDGGLGYMRVMRFSPTEDLVRVQTWSPYSWDENGNAWNPTYEDDDPDHLDPLNFRGDADEPFNEDAVCTAFGGSTGAVGERPGQCATWAEVDGLCGDLDAGSDAYTADLDGAPYRSFVARCNTFTFGFPMRAE